MRFNGVDILSLHPTISIAKEIPPGMPERELRTIAGKLGEKLVGVDLAQSEYVVRVNIAAKSRHEAWRVRALLAAWAMSSGEETAPLEPTHWPQVAYNAVVKSIDPPEFVFSHGVVEIVFALPDPVPYEQIPSIAAGDRLAVMEIGGCGEVDPVITYTPDADTDSLWVMLDGFIFLSIKGAIPKGAEVVIDMAEGSLLINGEHAESLIDYTETNWHPGFSPGTHKLSADAKGTIQARWHNKWA